MDAVSALGIASSVITFIEFAGSLTKNARAIYTSSKGATHETLKLEEVYSTLHELSVSLGDPPEQLRDASSDGMTQLRSVCIDCRNDCNEL
jgi:hypothetical protein